MRAPLAAGPQRTGAVPAAHKSTLTRPLEPAQLWQRNLGNPPALNLRTQGDRVNRDIPIESETQELTGTLGGVSDFSRIPAFGSDPNTSTNFSFALTTGPCAWSPAAAPQPLAPVLQTKLTINEPGDAFEQEADRLAERVMRTPAPDSPGGGECRKCSTPGQDDEMLQMKHVQPGDAGRTAAPPIVHEVLRSPGQPLDPATRAFMEPRFGHDFSRVRVHTGAMADESAGDVNALAYTVGSHVVFGAGRFAPGTRQGRRLIAHELTHVLQQGGGVAAIQRAPGDATKPATSPASRQAYQRYLETLREVMAKPGVTDPKLAEIVEKLYRDNPEIGSGSTAAAIRHELATGMPTKGTRHLQAGLDRLNMLADWLKAQKKLREAGEAARAVGKAAKPWASARDVAIAEHLVLDLQQAVHSGYYADFEITVPPPAGEPGGGGGPETTPPARGPGGQPVEPAATPKLSGKPPNAPEPAPNAVTAQGTVHAPQRGRLVNAGGGSSEVTAAQGTVRVPQRGRLIRAGGGSSERAGRLVKAGGGSSDVTTAQGTVHVPQRGRLVRAGGGSSDVTSVEGEIPGPQRRGPQSFGGGPGGYGRGVAIAEGFQTLLGIVGDIFAVLQAKSDFEEGDYFGAGLNATAATSLLLPEIGGTAAPVAVAWEGVKSVAELTSWEGRCRVLVAKFETEQFNEAELDELMKNCPPIMIGLPEVQRVFRTWSTGELPSEF